jgi:hypothetical protein
MSDGLKVLHLCDHVVKEEKFEDIQKSISRNTEGGDDKITTKEIESVKFVLFNDSYLFDGYHLKAKNQTVEWIGDDSIVPQPGETYSIYYTEKESTNRGFPELSCPKCSGKGWYVDSITPENEALSKATGVDKLVQDFIKTLLTNSLHYDYGTNLVSLIGKVHSKEDVSSKIKMAIREAEEIIKRSQYELSLENTELTDEETLRLVSIDDIYVNQSGDGYYVKITLYTKKNLSVSIGLDL